MNKKSECSHRIPDPVRTLALVPVTGLEPVRHRWRWILSPENRLESGGSEWKSVEEYTSKYSREIIRISKNATGARERAPPADRA